MEHTIRGFASVPVYARVHGLAVDDIYALMDGDPDPVRPVIVYDSAELPPCVAYPVAYLDLLRDHIVEAAALDASLAGVPDADND